MTEGVRVPPGTGEDGISESDKPLNAESEAKGIVSHSPGGKESGNSYSERTGIVSMYRGMARSDLWVSERASAEGHAGSSASPHGLPPVFAMSRVSTADLGVEDPSYSLGTDAASDRTEPVTHIATSSSSSSYSTKWSVTALSSAWHERYCSDTYIVCTDTSSSPTALGWSVRNVLTLLAAHVPQGREDRGPYIPDQQVQGPPEEPLPPLSPPSAGLSEIPSVVHSGVFSSNIIVLRGSTARKLYSCAGREKVEAFLQGLSDDEIGERE
jgi:hypothetical protein